MKRLFEQIKDIYQFYVDVYERLSRKENTEFQQQKVIKNTKGAKVIPFVPREKFYEKSNSEKTQKKIKKTKDIK